MIYIKHENKYKTLKDLAAQYGIPLKLIQGRYAQGQRAIEALIQPKYYNLK